MNRKEKEELYFMLFRGCALLVVGILAILIGFILFGGIGKLSIDFITQPPKIDVHGSMTQGGIFPAIVGTVYLMLVVLVFSVPIGVLGAVYLVEYQGKSRFAKVVWIVVHNLAGVPSIVYGLLGLGLLVAYLQLDLGILVAGITLGLLVLPVIIVTTREALIAVPPTVREASLALGATKWQTVRHHVIPYAMPGILTGMILSLSRAAGETAPILALGATALAPGMPSLFGPYMALPYHIYIMSSQSTNASLTAPIQYASALVLLIIVIGMNLFAIYLRKKYRDKYRW